MTLIDKSLLEFVSTNNAQEVYINSNIIQNKKKLVSINYLEILIKFNDYFINSYSERNILFLYTEKNSFITSIDNNKKIKTFHSNKCNCNGYFCSERILCHNKYGNTKCTHCSKFY